MQTTAAGPPRTVALWLAAIAAAFAAVVAAGCYNPRFDCPACSDGVTCPNGASCVAGVCQIGNSCDSGGTGNVPPPDASLCFGSVVKTCLTAVPTGTIDLASFGDVTSDGQLDTDDPLNCPSSGDSGYCVIAGETITVGQPVRAFGIRPLVLIASGTITINAVLDVGSSSRHGSAHEVGAGAASGSACGAGTPPAGEVGGAGGSFAAMGGLGGKAGGKSNSRPGPPTVSVPMQLRGGCQGQDNVPGDSGGHGGGAIYLIANQMIAFAGGAGSNATASILATGEGGAPSSPEGGGPGGGSGGMIVLETKTITGTALLLASGGGGSEGSSNGFPGKPGMEANSIAPALGGVADPQSTSQCDGGAGSSKDAPAGVDGQAGSIGSGVGGGGGGGAAGFILFVRATVPSSISTSPNVTSIP